MDNKNERRTIKPVTFEEGPKELQTEQPAPKASEQPRSRRIGAPAPQVSEEKAPAKIRNIGTLTPRRPVKSREAISKEAGSKEAGSKENSTALKILGENLTRRIKREKPKTPADGTTRRIAPVKKTRTKAEGGKTQRIRTYSESTEPQTAKEVAKNMGLKALKSTAMVVIGLLVMVFLGLQVYKFGYNHFVAPMGDDPNEIVEVVIDKNDSLSTISKKLEEAGIIRSSTVFKYYVDFSDMSSKLLAGQFELSPSMTYDEVINVLKRRAAAKTSTRVMLVEGILNEQIITKLEEASVFEDATDFDIQITRGTEYTEYWFVQEVLDKEADSQQKRDYVLEGYLFPDTYEFFIASDEESVIEKMLNRFNEIYTDEYRARAEELGMTTDEVVTLASIIQKEAGKLEDFKKVSAVFHNRLDSDMMLQSCATLQYFMDEKKFVYTAEETRTPSPYNTYIHTGLPVGPICNPGKDAIEAALWPDEAFMEEGYLYFCAGDPKEGTTVFAKTLAEHNANVAKYQHLW